MNRRHFLKTLSAIGVSLSIPVDGLSQVPDDAIDRVWSEAVTAPRVFYVNACGALSDRPGLEGFDFTQDRRDLFRLGETPASGTELIAFINSNSELENHVTRTFKDFSSDYWYDNEGNEDYPWETWQAWAMSGDIDVLIESVNDWLDNCNRPVRAVFPS